MGTSLHPQLMSENTQFLYIFLKLNLALSFQDDRIFLIMDIWKLRAFIRILSSYFCTIVVTAQIPIGLRPQKI